MAYRREFFVRKTQNVHSSFQNEKTKVRVLLVIALLIVLCCGCGEKYTCARCEETTKEAYYDPFRDDTYYCVDCAEKYFAPFPYTNYRVK